MKQLSLIFFAVLLVSACGNRPTAPETPAAAEKAQTKVIHLTTADFRSKVFDYQTATEWKYLGDKAAVIDFYATWCGPCKAIAPILEEFSVKYADSLYIYKVDVDKEPELSAAFGIASIPTLIFVPLHGEPQVIVGVLPKEDLETLAKAILKE